MVSLGDSLQSEGGQKVKWWMTPRVQRVRSQLAPWRRGESGRSWCQGSDCQWAQRLCGAMRMSWLQAEAMAAHWSDGVKCH